MSKNPHRFHTILTLSQPLSVTIDIKTVWALLQYRLCHVSFATNCFSFEGKFKTCVIFIPIFSITSVQHPSIFNLGWKFARKFHNDTRNGRNVSEIAEWYCSRQSVSQHDTLSFLKISAPPPPPPFHCQKRNVMHWLCSRKNASFLLCCCPTRPGKKVNWPAAIWTATAAANMVQKPLLLITAKHSGSK